MNLQNAVKCKGVERGMLDMISSTKGTGPKLWQVEWRLAADH